MTSLLIAALSFLPVLAFSGETGRLLRPLAVTKTLVVLAAAAVALTLAPALRDRVLGGRVVPELDNPLTRTLVGVYRPFVHFALRRPALTLATAALALVSAIPIAARLGGEFMPRLDEGELLYMPTTLPGVEPEQAAFQLYWQDHAMSQFGEVETVFGKVGRADTGTDPAPYSMAETVIRLRPRGEWPRLPRRAVVHAAGRRPRFASFCGSSGPTRPRAPASSWWPRWTRPSGCRDGPGPGRRPLARAWT